MEQRGGAGVGIDRRAVAEHDEGAAGALLMRDGSIVRKDGGDDGGKSNGFCGWDLACTISIAGAVRRADWRLGEFPAAKPFSWDGSSSYYKCQIRILPVGESVAIKGGAAKWTTCHSSRGTGCRVQGKDCWHFAQKRISSETTMLQRIVSLQEFELTSKCGEQGMRRIRFLRVLYRS